MDDRSLSRLSSADPEHKEAILLAMNEKARREGLHAWIEPLDDLRIWRRSTTFKREIAAKDVARRLGGDWDFKGMKTWSCPMRSATDKPLFDWRVWREEVNGIWIADNIHTLGLFCHKLTGIEFSLIPGGIGHLCLCGFERPVLPTSGVAEFCPRCGSSQMWLRMDPFLVARHPVTATQWQRAYKGPNINVSDDPQTNIEHASAMEWCDRFGFYLPSMREWKYAAGGGSATRYPWGHYGVDLRYVWCALNAGGEPDTCFCGDAADHEFDGNHAGHPMPNQPHMNSVREHEEAGMWNAFGLVDVYGNVQEWTSEISMDLGHIVLGGGYLTTRSELRNHHRCRDQSEQVGFRPFFKIPSGYNS